MGVRLVRAAYSVADRLGLDHGPTRLYVFMAAVALDSDQRPVYFGGRDALAGALGVTSSPGGYRWVSRTLQTLASSGAVEVAAKGAPGRNSRYGLLDGSGGPLAATGGDDGPVNNSEQVAASSTTGGHHGPEHMATTAPLRRREENKEEGRASAPTRSCTRHPDWHHNEPCHRCGADRRAFEAYDTARRPATMSESAAPCSTGHAFDLVSGYCGRCGIRQDAA